MAGALIWPDGWWTPERVAARRQIMEAIRGDPEVIRRLREQVEQRLRAAGLWPAGYRWPER